MNFEAIYALAARHYGAVTRGQLLAAGLTRHDIAARLRDRSLRRVYRGIYIAGPLTVPRSRLQAALWYCGSSALLSHDVAFFEWQLTTQAAAGIHVITSGAHPRARGLHVHRIRTLHPDERTILDGLPITTAARTLLDMAGKLYARALEQALGEALYRKLTSEKEVRELLQRHPRAHGAATLHALIAGAPSVTRSQAEERFLGLVRKAAAPEPEVNARVGRYVVDFLWRRQRLIIEVDGYRTHGARHQFERDRERDRVLTAAGYRVMRVTWTQLTTRPESLLLDLGQALAVA